jgi:hypothetical protein
MSNKIKTYKIITFENLNGELTKSPKEEYIAEYDTQGNKLKEKSFHFITGRDIIITDNNEVLKFNRLHKQNLTKLAEIKYVYKKDKPIEISTFYKNHWQKQILTYNVDNLLIHEKLEDEKKGLLQEISYKYNNENLLKEIKFDSKQEHTFTKFKYNKEQQLTNEIYTDADGSEIMRYVYKYDKENNLIESFLYAMGDKNNKRERKLITRNIREGFNETVIITVDYESGKEIRSKVKFVYDGKSLREEIHYGRDNQVIKVRRHVVEYY